MADVHNTGYLSIGEVLGLLLEDFPDVTISKIRFLESQGLISPERTASGYRKFYVPDVELLRVILTEQKSNYLPLRVIKDRLETGEIDPTGERLRPTDDGDGSDGTSVRAADAAERIEVPSESVSSHPASRSGTDGQAGARPPASQPELAAGDGDHSSQSEPAPAATTAEASDGPESPQDSPSASLMPGVLLDRDELCSMVTMTDDELEQLESFGIVSPRDGSHPPLYGDDAVEIAKPACEFLRSGVDARHLRNWRTSADREVSLYEQLVTPRFRQRNPESQAEALQQLKRLEALGGSLRAAMTRQALRHHFES